MAEIRITDQDVEKMVVRITTPPTEGMRKSIQILGRNIYFESAGDQQSDQVIMDGIAELLLEKCEKFERERKMDIDISEEALKKLGDNILVQLETNIPGGGAKIHLNPSPKPGTVIIEKGNVHIETLEHKPTIIASLEGQIKILKNTNYHLKETLKRREITADQARKDYEHNIECLTLRVEEPPLIKENPDRELVELPITRKEIYRIVDDAVGTHINVSHVEEEPPEPAEPVSTIEQEIESGLARFRNGAKVTSIFLPRKRFEEFMTTVQSYIEKDIVYYSPQGGGRIAIYPHLYKVIKYCTE